MRRSVPSIAAAVLTFTLLPTLAAAGWRSADRSPRDRDEPVVEEPGERDEPFDPQWQGAPGNEVDTQWHGHERRHHRHRSDTMPPQGTQPYWGTMRPYWNAPEPPGVIHRQPRTAPLKIQK